MNKFERARNSSIVKKTSSGFIIELRSEGVVISSKNYDGTILFDKITDIREIVATLQDIIKEEGDSNGPISCS